MGAHLDTSEGVPGGFAESLAGLDGHGRARR